MMKNILQVASREEFRAWLEENAARESGCWVYVSRGMSNDGYFPYLDAVEEALCFGWIDSIHKLIDGKRMQRFTPRKKYSHWTELNKEQVRRLEKLGRMKEAGRAVLPPMGPRSFRIDPEIEKALKEARVWSKFRSFPPLYQRVRADNLSFCKKRDPEQYEKALRHLIIETKKGRMYGDWNDGGRLENDADPANAE